MAMADRKVGINLQMVKFNEVSPQDIWDTPIIPCLDKNYFCTWVKGETRKDGSGHDNRDILLMCYDELQLVSDQQNNCRLKGELTSKNVSFPTG